MKIDDFLDSQQSNNQRAEAVRIDNFLGAEPKQKTKTSVDIPNDAVFDPLTGIQIAGFKEAAPNSKSILAGTSLPPELRNLPGDRAALERMEQVQAAPAESPILKAQKWTPAEERSTLRAIADTALGVHQGASGMVKGVADNINAGDNVVSNFFQTVMDGAERLKSDDLKEQQATRNMLIYGAKKSGEAAAARAAIQTLFDYPAAGGDVVARGAGSVVPTLALGAVGAGTRVMGGVNALANAGDAASQTADKLRSLPPAMWANDPQYQGLISQGMSHQDAINLLIPVKVLPAQGIGAVTGAASGFTGLERQLAGQVVGNTIKDRFKRAGTEILGEQAETLFPQVAGNNTVGAIDGKTNLFDGAGQSAVDTLAGTVPGAVLAMRRANVQPQQQPVINNPINNVAPPTPVVEQPAVNPISALADLITTTATQPSPLEKAPESAPTVDQFLGEPKPAVEASTPDAFLDEPATKQEPSNQDKLDNAFMWRNGDVDVPIQVVAEKLGTNEQGQREIVALVNGEEKTIPVDQVVRKSEAQAVNPPVAIAPASVAPASQAIEPVNTDAVEDTQAATSEPVNEPAFIDLDKHTQLQEPTAGMRIGDILYKNGSVFKTNKAAKDVAKKAGKGWVIAPSNQGYVVRFRPQTDKQIAATAKRVAKQREVTKKDSMLQAISKLGGINSDELVKDWGVSLADLKNKGSGVFWVATKSGVSADRMADSLKELGFISADPVTGKHDLAEMMDLFMEEARGGRKTYANGEGGGVQDQYSQYQNDGYDEWIAAKEAEEAGLQKLSEEAQALIGDWVGEQYDRTQEEYAKLDEELAQWEQSGEVQDRIPEFNNDAIDARGGRVAQEAGEFDANPAGEDRGDSGANQANEDTGQKQSPVRQTGAGSQRNAQESFSLESQTEAALKAAQEAKDAAEKAKQEADRAADARAKADAEVGQFNLTGSDREADVAAAQGQQDLLGSTQSEPAKPKSEIKDFGEKIGGARKDVWNLYGDNLEAATELDAASIPFARAWPEPNYEKLIQAGADPKTVAVVRAMRESVPTKPKKSYRLQSWANNVETLRNFANDLVKGKMPVNEIEILNKYSAIGGMADLYMAVGHSKSLANLRLSSGSYSVFEGKTYSPAKVIWAVEKTQAKSSRRWPTQLVTADTRDEAIAKFKESFDSLMNGATEKKSVEFVIYSRTKDKKFYVGKKVGRNYVDLAGGFETSKEAREYRAANQEELVAKLEKFKETPRVRREDNNPRVGEDMRNGEDVTPQYFGETFGFKGVEFGNWVEQGKRQADLNEAFDALMDMAAVLGLPPKALSLNGELSLAFGARGKGGVDPAKAHYESGFVVINMTKKSGAGSLGHEWWHALDNYFSRMGKKPLDFMTDSSAVSLASVGSRYKGLDDVRLEMTEAFGRVMKAIRDSKLKQRSLKMDGRRSKEYWSTGIEMSARSFESYLIAKLQDQGVSNDYLANIVSEKGWKAHEGMGMAEENSYPYPTVDELPALRAAFDSFFQTVETESSDTGVRVFNSSGNGLPENQWLSEAAISQVIENRIADFAYQAPIFIRDRASEVVTLPAGTNDSDISGLSFNGNIYLFRAGLSDKASVTKTLWHELLHHGIRRFMTRDQYIAATKKLYNADLWIKSKADSWVKTKEGQEVLAASGQEYAISRGVDEALADLAEENQGEFTNTGLKAGVIRTVSRWIAFIADKFGFKDAAKYWRAVSSDDARVLIRDIFDKLRNDAQPTNGNSGFKADSSFRIQDMEDDLQDDIDLGVPKQEYEKLSTKDFFSLSKNQFGQRQYTAGIKLYKNLATLSSKYLGAIKLADNKPEAFKQMMRQFKVDQLKANENAKRIAEVGMELSPEQRETLSDLIEKNAIPGDLPPTEIADLATKITAALDIQAKQLLDLGMISEERLVKNYLPRIYQHGLAAKLTNPALLAGWFTKARMRIRGDRLKTRGMFAEMPAANVAMAKKLGWMPASMTDGAEIPKDLFDAFDKSQPIPPNYQDTKVMMWRDYTEAERAEMGEIRDGVFRYAMGYVETQKDVAIGRLFKAIASNPELAKAHNPGGWKLVPTQEIKGAPGVKQYGALAGMYVSPQVLDALTRNTQPKGILMAAYDKALNFWKEGKTVWNPVSHSNNVVSNLFTIYFAGVNPASPSHWRETLREFRTKGSYWNEAVDNGLFGNEFANQEIQQMLMPDFNSMEDLESVAASRVAKVIEFSKKYPGKPLSWYRENMQKAYEFEDQFFKLMLYIDRRKSGMDPQEAITDAERYVFNYADMPEGIELLKRTYSPFFAYTYKAIPMVVHTFMTRPDRLLAPIALLGGANWLSYLVLGADEDKERKGMPEYMAGRTAIGTQKSIRMPFNIDDRPAFMDLSRRVPLGDLFDMNNQTNGMPLPAPFMPSHPVLSMMQAVIYNQDTFTGKDLVKKSDTQWEAAQARGAYLYRQFAPNAPMIPGSYNFNKLMEATANTFDTEIGSYTGKTKSGDAIKLAPTLLDVFTGTKIRSFDPERGLDYQAAGLQKEAKEIGANISSAQRNQGMTPDSKGRYIASQQDKLEELRKKNEKLRQ